MKVYRMYANGKELDKFLVTAKDLSEINVSNLTGNVDTYIYYNYYTNEYYYTNNDDEEVTLSFSCISKAIVD